LSAALGYFTDLACVSKPQATRDSCGQKARHLGRLLGTKQLDHLMPAQIERSIATRITDGAHTHTALTTSA